jgi:hypothetical protein
VIDGFEADEETNFIETWKVITFWKLDKKLTKSLQKKRSTKFIVLIICLSQLKL